MAHFEDNEYRSCKPPHHTCERHHQKQVQDKRPHLLCEFLFQIFIIPAVIRILPCPLASDL